MDNSPGSRRSKNPRGQGLRLRRDILQAASRILERSERDESVTLRAVAREVGITAPSIYAHFPDREGVIDALAEEGFVLLRRELESSHRGQVAPVGRLIAGSDAYLDFAASHPQRYRLMFTRTPSTGKDAEHPSVAAFSVLVGVIAQCAEQGQSSSVDPFADATAVWAGLHGLAMLRIQQPAFPWPNPEALLSHMVCSLARIAS